MNASNKHGSGGAVSVEMRSLLERRSTLQDWLTNLDNLGSRYRPAVTERVRDDYQARLGDVASELEGHRGAVESSLADRRRVEHECDQRLDSKSAEIEESELRFQIGEFDESTWVSRRDEHASKLESIQAELDVAAAAVQEMETVLAELDGTSGAATLREPEPKPELKPELVQQPDPAAEPEPKPDPVVDAEPVIELVTDAESTPKVEPNDDFLDELRFLESLSLDDTDSFDAVSRMLEDEETTGDKNSGRTDS
jgi:hypothetical protein